jgi:hypothetical protein
MTIRRRGGPRRDAQAPPSDLRLVKRAGRIAAVQASLALAAVLLVVGAVVFTVDVRVQDRQISSALEAVAATADDANDPPPGMELVLRDTDGKVSTSEGGQPACACCMVQWVSPTSTPTASNFALWSRTGPRDE